jgi:hypothetical protein
MEDLRVAMVWYGDPATRQSATVEKSRLEEIGRALTDEGIRVEACVYSDPMASEVSTQLGGVDMVLVWVNPTEPNFTRHRLDDLLTAVADKGVLVSAHPDVIMKMGTKEVLYATRDMSWGTDTNLYENLNELRQQLPSALAKGPRVLKQYRGNGGSGVFKVTVPRDGMVKVLHARRGSTELTLSLEEFLEQMAAYFDQDGRLIDQPYIERIRDGTVRCYLTAGEVVGFGEQLVNALVTGPDGVPLAPGPRLYYPPTREDFQPLKRRVEDEWVPEMVQRLDLALDDLPVIWDADFMYGREPDDFILCEINVSAVFPVPPSSLEPLARETKRRLLARCPP